MSGRSAADRSAGARRTTTGVITLPCRVLELTASASPPFRVSLDVRWNAETHYRLLGQYEALNHKLMIICICYEVSVQRVSETPAGPACCCAGAAAGPARTARPAGHPAYRDDAHRPAGRGLPGG